MCREGAESERGCLRRAFRKLFLCFSPRTAGKTIEPAQKQKEETAVYQALYRKWRPKTFEDVVGQEHITETMKRQVADGRLSHAYLFTGTRGTGKTTCAKILAKAVNCEAPVDGNPCNCCPSCLGIESGGFLDVLELDAASNNGVDQVRALRDEAVYAPANVKRRVYIVDEVHMLSVSAFNALLKILEEPPEHLMFILATTELHKVPATILSRCQRFAFKRITPQDVQRRLQYVAQQEQIDLRDDGAELLSRLADGALRDGLSLLDQCAASGGVVDAAAVLDTLGLAGNLQTAQLLRLILSEDAQGALTLLGDMYAGGKDMGAVLNALSTLARDLLIRTTAPQGGAALLSGGYDSATLEELGAQATAPRLIAILTTLQDTTASLLRSTNLRTDAELCILKLCDQSLSGDLTALVARVKRLENAVKKLYAAPPAVAAAVNAPAAAPVAASAAPRAADTAPALAAPIAQDDVPWEEPPLPTDADDPGEAGEHMDWEEPPQPVSRSAARPAGAPARGPVRQAPRESVRAVPRDNTPPPPVARQVDDCWPKLLDWFKSRLPMSKRAFLNMAGGRVEGDRLLIECDNELVRSTLSKDDVLEVFKTGASEVLGRSMAVQLVVKQAAPRASAPAAPVQRQQEDMPPAGAGKAEGGAPLEHLLSKMQGFDNLKIN